MLGPDFDLVMHRSWPPLTVTPYQGWLFRFSHGVTRRANSVLTSGSVPDLATAVSAAEAAYFAAGLPCQFMRRPDSEPLGLSQILADRGYLDAAHTQIMVCARNTLRQHRLVVEAEFQCSTEPSPEWLRTLAVHDSVPEDRLAILREIMTGTSALYCSIQLDGQIAAIARLSIDSATGWAGLSNVSTAPAFRRRGLASNLVLSVLHAGLAQGAERIFLQVEEGNFAAKALYADLGFQHAGDYFYSTLPQ